MVRRSLGSVGVACALVAVAFPRVSQAQSSAPRVTVGPFTGERAAVTRSLVSGVLANHTGEVELRSQSEYNSTAARLGAGDRVDEATVTTMARALGVDQVVIGSLERLPDGYKLRLRVLRGRDGRPAASASWEFQRLEEINAFSNEIWEQLRGAFQADPAMRAQPAGASERPSEVPLAQTEPNAPAEAPTAPASDAQTPGLGWLWFSAGGGLSGRRWRIPVLSESTQRGYENNAFGELRASVAAYYRLNNRRLGIGIESSISFPLGLSSQGRGPDGRVVPIATSALEFQFGASIAMRPTSGGLFRVFAGMIYHQFSLDTSRLSPEMRLAPVTYVGLRLAGEGTLPLYASPGWEFGVIFGGELRLAATGSEMKEAFGTNPDTTLGFGATFGLGLRMDRAAPGLGVRATAEFLRYATDFAGPARIGTPGESVDDYTRFLFTVVYALGTERVAPRSAAADTSGAPSSEEVGGGSSASPPPSGDPFGGR